MRETVYVLEIRKDAPTSLSDRSIHTTCKIGSCREIESVLWYFFLHFYI